jgi:hypothetical protein
MDPLDDIKEAVSDNPTPQGTQYRFIWNQLEQ